MGSAATGRSSRGVKHSNGSNGSNGRVKTVKRPTLDYLDPDHLIAVLEAVRKGDFSRRLTTAKGQTGQIYAVLNDIIEKNERLTSELNRISEVVGKEGRIAERAVVADASGGWASCVSSV